MRTSQLIVVGLIALLVGCGGETDGSAAAVEEPPAPVLSAEGRAVAAQLESWCRPAGDGGGGAFSCTAVSPAVGTEFPELRARRQGDITLDTRIAAERVRVELSPESGSGEDTTVHPQRLDSRRWRFQMPSDPKRAEIHSSYPDESTSQGLIFLRPRDP